MNDVRIKNCIVHYEHGVSDVDRVYDCLDDEIDR